MKKLSLDMDALRVESFAPDDANRYSGTVHGAADTMYDAGCPTYQTACPDPSCHANTQCCSGAYTCLNTCNATCGCTGGLRTHCGCASGAYTDCCQTNEPC